MTLTLQSEGEPTPLEDITELLTQRKRIRYTGLGDKIKNDKSKMYATKETIYLEYALPVQIKRP